MNTWRMLPMMSSLTWRSRVALHWSTSSMPTSSRFRMSFRRGSWQFHPCHRLPIGLCRVSLPSSSRLTFHGQHLCTISCIRKLTTGRICVGGQRPEDISAAFKNATLDLGLQLPILKGTAAWLEQEVLPQHHPWLRIEDQAIYVAIITPIP